MRSDTNDITGREFRRNDVSFRAAGLICAALAAAVGVTGLLEATGAVEMPMALEPLALRLPKIFPLHMAAGAAALLLIVAALALRRRPALHRPAGRLALVAVMIGGAAALPSALSSSASTVARAGFFAQGVVWLLLAALGYAAIRTRKIALHRAAMLAMAATAFGAVVLRLMLAALDLAGARTTTGTASSPGAHGFSRSRRSSPPRPLESAGGGPIKGASPLPRRSRRADDPPFSETLPFG